MNKIRLTLCVLLTSSAFASAQPSDSLRWREVFTDPQLSALIDTALAYNTDLRTATLRVEQADATLRMSRLSILPSLSAGAESSIINENGMAAVSKYSLPLRLQWEVGLSGRYFAENKAAESLLWNAEETERAVRLQLVAAIASQYYTLLMMDEQLAITREGVENARRTVDVMEAMKEVGLQNEAAVAQARTAWLSTAASEKTLQQQIVAAESAMMLLLGQQRDSIPRSRFIPDSLPLDYTAGIPLEALSGRPDVKAAEWALRAATSQTDVARSAFYPTLNITASFNILDMVSEAVGSLVQPLFNMGKNKGNLRIAKAEQEASLAAFSQTLLMACTELRDAMSACRFSYERLSLREQEVEAATKACEATSALMQSGSATYLEVLSAQAALLQSRLSRCSDHLDLLQGQINLYKASGGNLFVSLQTVP
ncbi:MAG: efflux transporter outer membrane subunit [Bacteroidales bacterium]|nr:efflux transporter outer membrane subunit [Bacteroidales bacterium]